MRAAVFIGGEIPVPGSLSGGLPPFDIAIAADSGLDAARLWGVAPDWLVGDMDSVSDSARVDAFPAERVRRFSRAKDDTDTELALSLAEELGCGEVLLIGGGGGRLDHLTALLALYERENPPARWLTRLEDVRLLDARTGPSALEERVGPGCLVSVFPFGPGPWAASSEGLRWPLTPVAWARGRFGISNVAVDGPFSIRAEEGRFLVMIAFGSRP